MVRHYLVLAVKVLLRRKFFTFISLFGISFTLMVLTVITAMFDHAFGPGGLHRVEINIRPENGPSRRVVEKLGFREEAYHPRYLHIDGAWRDHVGYAITTEDVIADGGLMARWRRLRSSVASATPPETA